VLLCSSRALSPRLTLDGQSSHLAECRGKQAGNGGCRYRAVWPGVPAPGAGTELRTRVLVLVFLSSGMTAKFPSPLAHDPDARQDLLTYAPRNFRPGDVRCRRLIV
jgi:hypothetical protein